MPPNPEPSTSLEARPLSPPPVRPPGVKRSKLLNAYEVDYAIEAASYVNVALNYFEQARRGSHRIAALPLYYALLNLSKVCILALLGNYPDQA